MWFLSWGKLGEGDGLSKGIWVRGRDYVSFVVGGFELWVKRLKV